MRPFLYFTAWCARRFRRDERGVTAIEFAIVAAPFFALCMGIITIGNHYFTLVSLERGVTDAARKIRTGEAQKQGKTVNDFRQMLCEAAGDTIECNSKLVIHIKHGLTFAQLDPPFACVTGGQLTPPSSTGATLISLLAGGQSATVLVTACYEWTIGSSLWQSMYDLIDPEPQTSKIAGKSILQSTSVFRSEPFGVNTNLNPSP